MTNIFEFKNYKKFVLNWVKSKPKSGYGQFKKISEHLGVGSVYVSQVFKADRNINEEQALELSEYFGLLDIEVQYFVLMVRRARAGTNKLRKHIDLEMQKTRDKATQLKTHIQSDKELDETDKSIFYSNWIFSAIRLAIDIPSLRTVSALSHRLNIEPEVVKHSVDFLVEKGLCVLDKGQIRMGPQIVFLDAESPYVKARQISWRVKSIENMDSNQASNLFFTCPMVCSKKTQKKIRANILKLINDSMNEIKDSPSEELSCLNIDWFSL